MTVETTAMSTVPACRRTGHAEKNSSNARADDAFPPHGFATVIRTVLSERMNLPAVSLLLKMPAKLHTSVASQANVSLADGAVTMKRTALMALTRSTALMRSTESVQWKNVLATTESAFISIDGVMDTLTVRTALTKSSAM
jgi:transglutaminase/protease-like cytokinesis protein 3